MKNNKSEIEIEPDKIIRWFENLQVCMDSEDLHRRVTFDNINELNAILLKDEK